nr:endonuclease/exonuclease/phosphatase family protein [uncultured Carboxylicivirga sp.]
MHLRLIYTFLSVIILTSCGVNDRTLSVMSFNVRYDNDRDGINSWENRKDLALSFIDKESPDVIGFQEVLPRQLNHLQEHLTGYSSVAAGRDDGKLGGEMVPIFFNKEKFELISSSHFWLSNTPEVAGSKSWGAYFPRVVTWVQLKNLDNGYIFYVFNTHFSHVSEFARNESAVLLLDKIHILAGDAPVIVTGDFNASFDELCYKTLTGNWKDHTALWDSRFENLTNNNDLLTTFNGFKDDTSKVIIDHIFVNGMFLVQSFKTYPVKQNDTFISDHYPVKAILSFRLNEKKKSEKEKELIPSLPDPYFNTNELAFEKEIEVPISIMSNSTKIFYTIDGSSPDTTSLLYEGPIKLKRSTSISAFAYSDGKKPSSIISKTFIRKGNLDEEIIYFTPADLANQQGVTLLSDLKHGKMNLEEGWVKSDTGNVEITYKLAKRKQIKELYISYLIRPIDAILGPKAIEVSVSNNNETYELFGTVNLVPSTDTKENQNCLAQISGQKYGRYLKIKFINPGLTVKNIPSSMYIDEIILK